MHLPKQSSAFSVLVLVLIFSPLIPSHKYKKTKKDHSGGISMYEVPHHFPPPFPPQYPAYPAAPTYHHPTTFGGPIYDTHSFSQSYFPPPPLHPPYGVSYVPVCTRNCGDDEGKKSNKAEIKALKKEEFKIYKGLKHMTKELWKSYKKDKDEGEMVTVHRPVYHPPPPPRLVEVRVPRCKDTVEVPTYITETLIKTHKVYVTKTRTKTTERHIKEYVVNTEYQTKTATKVVSHYAAPETQTVYSPPEIKTVYSPPETIVKTQHVTHHHPTTEYVPHYVTVTVAPEPSYETHMDYSEHATPYHATEHFPPSSYNAQIQYAKRQADDAAKQAQHLQAGAREADAGKIQQNQQTTSQ
ncbi:hypothetical protein FHG87_020028 [Trinorchestia longiramus]|nr:hypothetical protein FHG87_020028 [Trinorchestia longiramus]